MKTLKNTETLEAYGVVEMNETEMQEVDGGLLPLIIALAVFDAALWGYILS
jgi:lactobin A/cerein 7B family class IIb bacteriocin